MKGWRAFLRLMTMASVAALALAPLGSFAAGEERPHTKVVKLDSAGKNEIVLLSGPPETVTMKSGLVILEPGQTVGKHSTGAHEEMLVILEGKGAMMFNDGTKLEVDANHILYCPPDTEHDMRNTGAGVLRYVYIVANAK
jgi:mannose-6-phosphate isomerase-like protein (cupin superfamily)